MTLSVDTKRDEVVVECEMEATPEKLWRALTEEAFLSDWLDARPSDEAVQAPECRNYRLLEAKPYSHVSYAWHDPDHPDAPSLVTVELERLPAGRTWFRLTHGPVASGIHAMAANTNRQPLAMAG